MNDTNSLTASQRCARSLLATWNRGDLAGLQARLDIDLPMESAVTESERERFELVQEIASTIRLWLQGMRRKDPADIEVSLRLLRHLARCEETEDVPAVMMEGMHGLTTTEVVRPGMLVFFQN